MSEWQPIETASDNGPYLVSDGKYRWIVQAELAKTRVEIENWLGDRREPTHWMPLPTPPETK